MSIPFSELPDTAFLRERQLLGGLVPFSSATLWRRVGDGGFPKPIKLGSHITVWRVGDVRSWLELHSAPAPVAKKRRA